jgi:phage terminase Nu1 subunit (DNA packaging protein)
MGGKSAVENGIAEPPEEVAERSGDVQDPEYSAPVIAAILGITDVRLRQLVKEGMPKSSRGRFPLTGCVQWYVAYWRDRALGRKDDDNRNRKTAAEAKLLEAKVQQHTGHLIERAQVLSVWTGAVMRLAKAFETLPNNLAREFNWPPEAVRALRQALDDFRRAFVHESAEFVDVIDEPSGESKAV